MDLLNAEDVKIDLVPKHPLGGQYAGTRPYLMTVSHEPSGLSVTIDLTHMRSQHKARSLAFEMIECALTSPQYRP